MVKVDSTYWKSSGEVGQEKSASRLESSRLAWVKVDSTYSKSSGEGHVKVDSTYSKSSGEGHVKYTEDMGSARKVGDSSRLESLRLVWVKVDSTN